METAFIAISLLCVQSSTGAQCMSNVQQYWFPTFEICQMALTKEENFQHSVADKGGERIYNEVRRCLEVEKRPALGKVD